MSGKQDVEGSKSILYDNVMVHMRQDMFFKAHRMYKTESELEGKRHTLVNNGQYRFISCTKRTRGTNARC